MNEVILGRLGDTSECFTILFFVARTYELTRNRERVDMLKKRVEMLKKVEVSYYEEIVARINNILEECKAKENLDIPKINGYLKDLTLSSLFDAAKEALKKEEREYKLPTLPNGDVNGQATASPKVFNEFVKRYLDGFETMEAVVALSHAILSIYTYLYVRCSTSSHIASCTKGDVKRALGLPADDDINETVCKKVQHYFNCVNTPLSFKMQKFVLVAPPWKMNCGANKLGGLGGRAPCYKMIKLWIRYLPRAPQNCKAILTSLGYA